MRIQALVAAMLLCFAPVGAFADEPTDREEIQVPPPPPAPRQEPRPYEPSPPPAAPMAMDGDRDYGPRQGMWEATLNGAGQNDNDWDNGGFTLSGSVGYFFTDLLEGIVRQSVSFADSDDADSVTVGTTRVGLHFHIPVHERFYPYIGANVGGIYGDIDETGIAGPEVGLKWYALERTFLFVNMEYQFLFDSDDEFFDEGVFAYGVGVGFNF